MKSEFSECTNEFTPPHAIEGAEMLSRTVIRDVVVPIRVPRLKLSRQLERRRGETVFVDYLSFTLVEGIVEGYGDTRLRNVAQLFVDAIPELGFSESDRGLYGFTHSGDLTIAGETVGKIATGGNNGRTFVEFTGKACAWIDREKWATWLDQVNARISRVDLAYDDYEGSHSVHWMKQQYIDGEFKNRGQNPNVSQIGPWLNRDLWENGLTLYVGKRQNGKMLRSYEKGRQLGDSKSKWVRHEVEFRRTREKPLTTDMIRNPVEYLTGSYTPLEWIADVTPARVDRVKLETKITFETLVHYARLCYGKLFHVMSQVIGDPEKIIQQLCVEGFPRRLNQSAMVAA
ncbi:replication initiation factor domain-containing protein [Candidatus Thiodiazotropha sp. CDECU1]|uniref:replication initiation factor domain-containing protein n=1 Tax=Candidatus Thiodiazotropha sp. CDECU1 TaxID=3065865 RepID=UPI00292FE10E|nr:replication initiation factor domain-containing protein [Candidatus Thiodiazotropha sp. CDECU1]